MANIAQESDNPSHPALFTVDCSSTSRPRLRAQKVCVFPCRRRWWILISPLCQRFEAGEIICFLDVHSKGSNTPTKLQCGHKDRIELRSDLSHSWSHPTTLHVACG
jgi:hypothetical protein